MKLKRAAVLLIVVPTAAACGGLTDNPWALCAAYSDPTSCQAAANSSGTRCEWDGALPPESTCASGDNTITPLARGGCFVQTLSTSRPWPPPGCTTDADCPEGSSCKAKAFLLYSSNQCGGANLCVVED